MKMLILLVLAIVAGTNSYLIKVPTAPIVHPTLAPSGWIHLQKLVLPLFENVCEPSTNPELTRLSQEFPSALSPGDFWDSEVLTKFQTLKTGKGFLPKGQIFSEYNVEHTNELKIMFDIMCNAKTFDTFYKVAAWSRQNLNCGLYVNLIYMALENRRDTEKLTLPAPYELLPNYFIRKDIIIQGSSLLAGEEFTPSEGVRDEGNAYMLDANYTANIYDNDDESKLAYFREDIGLNSYYFLKMLKWAPKLSDTVNINSIYGEKMYHVIKQLVARYNLERYANGISEQNDLSWDSLSDAPYDPMLVYSNGNEFIHRTSPVQLPENEDKALLTTIENNLSTVVGHMRDAGYNKTQILNHLMEILVTGERSYDTLARHLLGKALSNNGEPTVFEHYMTSLRDPMVWRMYKKIVYLVDNALEMLPSYSRNELYFPGVEVVSVDVKKIMTNFENFEFDITEALKIGNGDTSFRVKIGQSRLNHKPFMMKVNITSIVTQRGLVKIYLGPKMMPGEFAKNKNQFITLDSFEINLKKGSNIVSRSSNDMKMYSSDFMSLKTLRKKVEDAQFGLDALPLNTIESQIGFPERLIVPKGTPEGLPLQLFVFVAPYMKISAGGNYMTPSLEYNSAVLSPLYPLDLTMEDRILLTLPNAFLKDIIVTHKDAGKAKSSGSMSKPMYDNENGPYNYKPKNFGEGTYEYDFSTKNYEQVQDDNGLNYPLKQQQSYNYMSGRQQYQKPDYAAKKVDYKTIYQNKKVETTTETLSKELDKELVNEQVSIKNSHPEQDKPIYNAYEFDDNMQNDDPLPGSHLLKSSATEYFPVEMDTKFVRPKILRPDYKKLFKNVWKMTESPFNKMSKTKVKYDDMTEYFQAKPTKVEIFRIIKNDYPYFIKDSKKKKDYNLYEEVENRQITKGFGDQTDTTIPIVIPSKNYNKFVYKDVNSADDGQYFGLYEDNSGEKVLKVVTDSDLVITDPNSLFKYIMEVMNNEEAKENVIYY